nr:hypothetical protein [Tanacetum cinerariifolium]
MRPFRCPIVILNIVDHLGKFDGKADEGFFVGYSLNSKAFRVFNSRTRIVKENLHIKFSESTPNVVGSGPDWLFDIDALTRIINYEPIVTVTKSNGFAGIKTSDNAGQARKETKPVKHYILLPLWTVNLPFFQDLKSSNDDRSKPSSDDGKKVDEDPRKENECNDQEKKDNVNNTNNVNTADNINTLSSTDNAVATNKDNELPFDPNMSTLEDVSIFNFLSDDEDDDHLLDQVIGDLKLATQTRKMLKNLKEYEFVSTIQQRTNHKDFKTACLLAFYHKKNPKSSFLYGKIEEEVYVCQLPGFEDLDFSNRVYKVKKAPYRLHQAPKSWHKGDILLVYVYLDDIIFGSTKKELCFTFEKLMHEKLQMSYMGELTFFLGLQVKQKKDGIFISQDKYVAKILKKFRFIEVKTASTPMETQKSLLKDEDGEEVDVHMYREMISSLMYLTYLRLNIMFAMYACVIYQVNPNVSYLYTVKRIFRYLKGQPKLGLWYLKDSLFDLVAYADIDYIRASLDRKSTTGGCQFLGCKLISWQCKKLTVAVNSIKVVEYVAASS